MNRPQRCALDTSTTCSTVPTSPHHPSPDPLPFPRALHCLRAPSHKADVLRDLCCSLPFAETEDQVYRRTRFLGASPLHLHTYVASKVLLHSASSFLGPVRPPETKYEQHPHCHPIIWSRCTSISSLRDFLSTPREVISKVVGRVVSTPTDVPQLPTPPSSHSNVPSPANSMSPVTPPNYEGDTAKIVSSTGSNTMHISSDNISPPYHHVHARKSSSPIPAYTKSQISLDTKHTSPKRTSSAHQHAPVKSNTVYTFARPCVW